jgi:hypothetical protein
VHGHGPLCYTRVHGPPYYTTRCTGPSGSLHLTAWFFWPKANLAHREHIRERRERIRERICERIRECIRERIREVILEDGARTKQQQDNWYSKGLIVHGHGPLCYTIVHEPLYYTKVHGHGPPCYTTVHEPLVVRSMYIVQCTPLHHVPCQPEELRQQLETKLTPCRY